MIGVFDSGVGGLCAFGRLRELLPYEDMLYLADRANAPYGTKSEDEILEFTENNIRLLSSLGCRRVLIACCSASSVWHRLGGAEREISTPIIRPAAALAASLGGRVTVIATSHTVRTGAFTREIGASSQIPVTELGEQGLVTLVEAGNRDGCIDSACDSYLRDMTDRIRATGCSVLILGCTHFSHLMGEISGRLPNVKIISPAHVGAVEIMKKINPRREGGAVGYIATGHSHAPSKRAAVGLK